MQSVRLFLVKFTRFTGVLTLLGVILIDVGCRSRKRSAKVGTEAPKVEVALLNMDETHRGDKAGLIYEIECGSEGWVSGDYIEDSNDEVQFALPKAKSGDVCSVRIVAAKPSDEVEYLKGGGILYATDRRVILTTRGAGQLWAQAFLSPSYRLKIQGVKLEVPVVFPAKLPSDANKLFAKLKCVGPELAALAVGLDGQDPPKKSGRFVFDLGVQADTAYQCNSLQVSSGSTLLFLGDLNAQFKLKEGEVKTLDPVTLREVSVESTTGIVIITVPGVTCPVGQVYDEQKKKCVPRP